MTTGRQPLPQRAVADLPKIDGSFIVHMNRHPANIAIVSLVRNLGMTTIAEWAGDTATVRTLVEIGVDDVQGDAVARPQKPSVIFVAGSSAGFIEDAQLKGLAQLLGHPDTDLPQVAFLAPSKPLVLH